MQDAALACEMTVEVDAATGLRRQTTRLRNRNRLGGAEIALDHAAIPLMTIPDAVAQATYLTGDWAAEAQTRTQTGGALHLESRAGKTGFTFQPWLALSSPTTTWMCEILWSGNWVLDAQITPEGVTISGGLNPFGLHHRLLPGEALALPDMLLGRIDGDLNTATQCLHDWLRARRPDPDRLIPVQFNSWYVCGETPEEARLASLIPLAAELGCEVFVLDAGWFASNAGDPDEDWYLRVGDWTVDRTRLPNGLAALRDSCAAHGMGFGIWCEPESVGPRAAIRANATWFHHLNHAPPPDDARAQLHLGVPEAWAWARDILFGLIRHSGSSWLKWDFNADLFAGGWAPGLPDSLTRQDPLSAHVRGVYRLQDAIRAEFPDLVLEMCASGGGRMDGAILERAHTNWISDQPKALAKLAIHFGIQRVHPALCCNDWLIDWPPRAIKGVDGIDTRGDLRFRLHVAMLGSFGLSAPIDAWPALDRAIVAAEIALYRNRLRPLIHLGNQYLLTDPPPLDGEGDWAAMWYVAKDGTSAALFAFRLRGAETRSFPVPGLAQGRQRLTGDGASLTRAGLCVTLAENFRSALLIVDVDPSLSSDRGHGAHGFDLS